MVLYEEKQFELKLDDKYITLLNKRVAHMLPRDELQGRPDDRFGASQLFGFSRIKHLTFTLDTMFPQANDACRANQTKYDISMCNTVERLVVLLRAEDLHPTQKGLVTLKIVFEAGDKVDDKDGDDPIPRQAHFGGACETGFALDFVLRPLAKLRGVHNVSISFPEFVKKEDYQGKEVLEGWTERFSKEVTSHVGALHGDLTQDTRIASDTIVAMGMPIEALLDMFDTRNLQRDYQLRFPPQYYEPQDMDDSEKSRMDVCDASEDGANEEEGA